MTILEKINNFMRKKLFINDTLEITMGRLSIVLFVTIFQFLGMWVDNSWVIVPSMFFLIANTFFSLGKSTKEEEKTIKKLEAEKKELNKQNRCLIGTLNKEIFELKKEIKEHLK